MPQNLAADSIGPVDVAVILFEGNQFNGEVAPAIVDLQQSGTVRILDLAFITKDTDGAWAILEIADDAVEGAFQALLGEQFELLSDNDLEEIAADLGPESSALVIVWENVWAAQLASTIRGSNGQVIAMDRIPHDIVARAIAALDEE